MKTQEEKDGYDKLLETNEYLTIEVSRLENIVRHLQETNSHLIETIDQLQRRIIAVDGTKE